MFVILSEAKTLSSLVALAQFLPAACNGQIAETT
jgi:hypothetical protein